MGDLKSVFNKPVYPDATDLSGQGVVSRGNDPNADGGTGPDGFETVWPAAKRITTDAGMAETPNSVSGLPLLPNRFEPSESRVEIPSMKDRNPGTIDKQ
jgi:hypothetical protein